MCGTLPYTLTVEFSGLVNRTHSTYCPLSITSNFGCGAAAVATSPGGCDDSEPDCGESNRGPLAGVLLLDGGHDYARLGRREPVLSLAGSPGSGATFTVTLEPVDASLAAQCRSYKVADVTVDGGTGYVDGTKLSVTTDGKTVTPAVLTLVNERTAPTITATVAGGTGAVLAVSLTSSGSPPVWGVAAVSVTSGGSGYTDGAEVVFTVADGDQIVSGASATISVGGGEPNDCVAVSPISVTGTEAAFSWTWLPVTGGYQIVPVIDDGGSGYTVGDFFYFEDTCHDDGPAIYVDAVDGGGAITAVSGGDAYVWPPASGSGISSVTVTAPGEAFHDTGVPESVTVDEPGVYYTEDPTAPVCLAEVTVSADACGGSGAEITATIGDDPEDGETFGRITSLTIDDGGDGYLVWHWMCTRQSEMNDVPIVLTANDPTKLVTLAVESCYGSGACLHVVPIGDGTTCDPPIDVLYDGGESPIREVEVVDGGSGYATYGREEPQWVAAAYGWSFTPSWGESFEDDCGRSLWAVESFTIANVSGVPALLDGWPLTWIVTHPEHQDAPFSAVVRTRQSPTVTATAGGTGVGATFAVTLEDVGGQPREWRVASVAVTSGGSGYSASTPVTFSVPARGGFYGHYTGEQASGVAVANDGGEIISVSITSAGRYWRDEGIPQSVEMLRDGNDEIIGGRYYRENPALTPYVSTPTVVITQLPPSDGDGAAISVTVGSDPSNAAEFGKILTATVTSQGSGYTLLGGPQSCVYSGFECDSPAVEYRLRGNGKPPHVVVNDIVGEYVNTTVLECANVLEDCDDLPASASLLYGAPAGVTATITRGGIVTTECDQPAWCGPCACPLDGVALDETTPVEVTMDFGCDGGGALSATGTWGDLVVLDGLDDNCGQGNNAPGASIDISLACCQADCNATGECVYKILVTFFAYVLYQPFDIEGDPNSGAAFVEGSLCTDAITINQDGTFSGTVNIPCSVTGLVGQNDTTTVAVTFG